MMKMLSWLSLVIVCNCNKLIKISVTCFFVVQTVVIDHAVFLELREDVFKEKIVVFCIFKKVCTVCLVFVHFKVIFVNVGVSDSQLEEVYTSTGHVQLPAIGSYVKVIITTIVSPTRFFAQIPMGSKSVLSKSSNNGML